MGTLSQFLTLHRKEAVFALIIFLVASFSFGMGYLVNREFNRAPIVIEKCSDVGLEGF